jgi:CobQ-like glutamine amidotransferase family enzyme
MTAPRLGLLALYPEVMDVGADTANLAVLRVRAGWEGVDARVETLALGAALPAVRPDVVMVGSGADEDLAEVCPHLVALGDRLRDWLAAGTVLLAVGSALDLLAQSWERAPGEFVAGAAVFGGEARLLPGRASGDLVVEPGGGGEVLVGYENHSRGYLPGAHETPLGVVRRGIGNGAGAEGVAAGPAIGTHVHGPLFARNPAFADRVLGRAMAERHGGVFEPTSAEVARADALAARTRESLLR